MHTAEISSAILNHTDLVVPLTQEPSAAEAGFRQLFQNTPAAIIMYDAHGIIRTVNTMAAQWFERATHDLIGRHISAILAPHEVVHSGARIQQTLVHGTSRFETIYVSRTGRCMAVDVSNCTITLDGQPTILSVAYDIGN